MISEVGASAPTKKDIESGVLTPEASRAKAHSKTEPECLSRSSAYSYHSRPERSAEVVVRAEGVEPTRAVKPCGFSCRLRLSPPGCAVLQLRAGPVCGLDYPFTVPREDPGLRCCPSSLYTFPAGVFRQAWLGIAISGFPEFEQFCITGFPASTQVFLKSAASAIPPRPRGRSSAATYHRAGRGNLHVGLRRKRANGCENLRGNR